MISEPIRQTLEDFVYATQVAYFSMEIALRNEIPTYSGGLGILAGDTLRSAADLGLPLVAVTLVSSSGYFRQEIDADGRQRELSDDWEPARWATPLGAKVSVRIGGRDVWIAAWLYVLEGQGGGKQPILLLDTDLDENVADDRALTRSLYGGETEYRLKQEIVLGIGGARMLHAVGFHRIRQYHMNEGHSALLILELLKNFARRPSDLRPGEPRYDLPRVREMCNFTTHTPVEAGHDKFPYDLLQRLLDEFPDLAALRGIGGESHMNMTQLALNMSEYINGVARRHAETSRQLFPGYTVRSITNGVHPYTWTTPGFARLYDRYLDRWCHEPELLINADAIPDEALWRAHAAEKGRLLELVVRLAGRTLDPGTFTIGFARRMTAYKRPDLIFHDLDRLRRIAATRPLQIIFAGKAHPRDEPGKRLIALIHEKMRELAGAIHIVFLPNYDMNIALHLVGGVDLWLNTPLAPQEASGTSGMKAALNGVPSLSTLDGWWVEGHIEGVTGWAIGAAETADQSITRSLYEQLETKILPLYYGDGAGWVRVMKGAICRNGSLFNSHRMLRRYATEAYMH